MKIQYVISEKERNNIKQAISEVRDIRLYLLPKKEIGDNDKKLLTAALWHVMDLLEDVLKE